MKVHSLMAAFMLPAVFMFLVTGALYTWGTKGSYHNTIYEIRLNEPLSPQQAQLQSVVQDELAARGLSAPSGKSKVKTYGSHFLFEWTGSSSDVIFEPTEDPFMAKLTVKNATWYRTLVQLHKAKGGMVFKVYATFFALALFLLILSGYIMAWQMPRLRGATITATMLGLMAFLAVVFLS